MPEVSDHDDARYTPAMMILMAVMALIPFGILELRTRRVRVWQGEKWAVSTPQVISQVERL